MSDQKYIDRMTGYKATDANMVCKGSKFELGVWYEIEGDIALCERGFHFCVQPSGPSTYYTQSDARIFKAEAEQVLEVETAAGADFKLVAKRIRLVEEITPGKVGNDKSNTGHSNTGDSNTGHSNTGHRNTGHRNTGDSNTGDRNTGHRNTGHSNTGHSNTGYSNTTNNSSGFFCQKEPKVISFDKQTRFTREQFCEKYPEIWVLSNSLIQVAAIDFDRFKRIPGITPAKLKSLHRKHLLARKLITK